MKSAYELAMERLNKSAPATKLSAAQKKQLAELDAKYAAKVAEREISIKDDIGKAASAGEFEKVEQLQQQLVVARKNLQAELEEKKEGIRRSAAKKKPSVPDLAGDSITPSGWMRAATDLPGRHDSNSAAWSTGRNDASPPRNAPTCAWFSSRKTEQVT